MVSVSFGSLHTPSWVSTRPGQDQFRSGVRDLPPAHASGVTQAKRAEDRYDFRQLLLSPNNEFYGGTSKTQMYWGQSRAWVVYLMKSHRPGVEEFLRQAFRGGQGQLDNAVSQGVWQEDRAVPRRLADLDSQSL